MLLDYDQKRAIEVRLRQEFWKNGVPVISIHPYPPIDGHDESYAVQNAHDFEHLPSYIAKSVASRQDPLENYGVANVHATVEKGTTVLSFTVIHGEPALSTHVTKVAMDLIRRENRDWNGQCPGDAQCETLTFKMSPDTHECMFDLDTQLRRLFRFRDPNVTYLSAICTGTTFRQDGQSIVAQVHYYCFPKAVVSNGDTFFHVVRSLVHGLNDYNVNLHMSFIRTEDDNRRLPKCSIMRFPVVVPMQFPDLLHVYFNHIRETIYREIDSRKKRYDVWVEEAQEFDEMLFWLCVAFAE